MDSDLHQGNGCNRELPQAELTRLRIAFCVSTEGDDPGLLDSDNAAPVAAAAIQHYKAVRGEDAAKAAWAATGLELKSFLFSVRCRIELSWLIC